MLRGDARDGARAYDPGVSLSAHLRCAAWLLAGSLAVHELRYLFAFGDGASQRLGETGHGYLTLLMPVATMALAFVAGRAIVRPGAEPTRSWRATWALLAAALLGIYTVQELAEGWLAAGHPNGLAGVFGAGGWLAVPLAVGFAAIATFAVHVGGSLRRALRELRSPRPRRAVLSLPFVVGVVRPLHRVMATAAPGRAPPLPVGQ